MAARVRSLHPPHRQQLQQPPSRSAASAPTPIVAAASAANAGPSGELTLVVATFSAFNFDNYQGPSLGGYANGIVGGPVFEELWSFPLPGKDPQPFLLQSATPSG